MMAADLTISTVDQMIDDFLAKSEFEATDP
jgi:hypothetical protein